MKSKSQLGRHAKTNASSARRTNRGAHSTAQVLGLAKDSLTMKILCVVVAVLLALLLVPSGAMSVLRAHADNLFGVEADSAQQVEAIEEPTEEVTAQEAESEVQTNDASIVKDPTGQLVLVTFDANGKPVCKLIKDEEELLNSLNVDYNTIFNFGEFTTQVAVQRLGVEYNKTNVDMDLIGGIGVSDANLSYVKAKTEAGKADDPAGYYTKVSSNTGASGNWIKFKPNADATFISLSVTPNMLQKDADGNVIAGPEIYIGKAVSTEVGQTKKVLGIDAWTEDVSMYTKEFTAEEILGTGQKFEAGQEYYIFTNSNKDTDTSYSKNLGGIAYNMIQFYNTSKAISGTLSSTTINTTAKVEFKVNSETVKSIDVNTSTQDSTRFVIPNIDNSYTSGQIVVTADDFNTVTKEVTLTESTDVGMLELIMANLSISGTFTSAAGTSQSYVFDFWYYDTSGAQVCNTQTLTLSSGNQYKFDNVTPGRDAVLVVYRNNTAHDYSFTAFVPAMTKSLTNIAISMNHATAYKFGYNLRAISAKTTFNVLGQSGATRDYWIPTANKINDEKQVYFPALKVNFTSAGLADVICNKWNSDKVVNTGFTLSEATWLEIQSPYYIWSEETSSVHDPDKDVTCTAYYVYIDPSGQRIQITETVIATGVVIKSPTTSDYGVMRFTAKFTKLIDGQPIFSTQTIEYNTPTQSEHVWQEITFHAYTSSTTTLPSATGNYYLTQDIHVTSTARITNGSDVKLDLNGHMIYWNSTSTVPRAYDIYNGSLSIYDSQRGSEGSRHYFSKQSNGKWVPLIDGTSGDYYIDGGVFAGFNGPNTSTSGMGTAGGAILVESTSCTLNVYEGAFAGNYSGSNKYGGVIASKGIVNILGYDLAVAHSSIKSTKSVTFAGNVATGSTNDMSNGSDGGSCVCAKQERSKTHVEGAWAEDNTLLAQGQYNSAVFNVADGETFEVVNCNIYRNKSTAQGGGIYGQKIWDRVSYEQDPQQSGSSYQYQRGFILLKNSNVMYNQCSCKIGSSTQYDRHGGGVNLSTNIGSFDTVVHLKLSGLVNVTENTNQYGIAEGAHAPSDNICLEREARETRDGSNYVWNHSRIIFDDDFNKASNCGVNTRIWNEGRTHTAFPAQITLTEDGKTADPTLMACFTEDTVLSADDYTLAYRYDATSDQHVHGDGVGELYLIKHSHNIQHTLFDEPDRQLSGKDNSIKFECSDKEGEVYQQTKSEMGLAYDIDFQYADKYKCRYSLYPVTMKVHGEDCVYDGEEHPVVFDNLTEVTDQHFAAVDSTRIKYYKYDETGSAVQITGVPKDAGTYFATAEVQTGWNGTRFVGTTELLTSHDYTISKRQVKAYIIGTDRQYNGSGYMGADEVLTSYLDKTDDRVNSGVIPGEGVYLDPQEVTKVIGGEPVTVKAGSYLQTYADYEKNPTTHPWKEHVAETTYNPIAKDEKYNGYVLTGTTAGNYEVVGYDGYMTITPFVHQPVLKDKVAGRSEGYVFVSYSDTFNWADDGENAPWYYGQNDNLRYPWLHFSYVKVNEEGQATEYSQSTNLHAQTPVVTVNEPEGWYGDGLGTRLTEQEAPIGDPMHSRNGVWLYWDPNTNLTGDVYLRCLWEGRDVDGDGTNEFGDGSSPDDSYNGRYIKITITDNYQPSLDLSIKANKVLIDDEGNDYEVEIAENENLYVGERIKFYLTTRNYGATATTNPIRFSNVAQEGTNYDLPSVSYQDKLGIDESTTVNEEIYTVESKYAELGILSTAAIARSLFDVDGSLLDIQSNVAPWSRNVTAKQTSLEPKDRKYNGVEQLGYETIDSQGFEITEGTASATDVPANDNHEYTFTAKLKEGYVWDNGETTERKITWHLEPRQVLASAGSGTYTYDGQDHKPALLNAIYDYDSVQINKLSQNSEATSEPVQIKIGENLLNDYISVPNNGYTYSQDSFIHVPNSTDHTYPNAVYINAIKATRNGTDISRNYSLYVDLSIAEPQLQGDITINPAELALEITGAEASVEYTSVEQTLLGWDIQVTSGDAALYNVLNFVTHPDNIIVASGTNPGIYVTKPETSSQFSYDVTKNASTHTALDIDVSLTIKPGKLTIIAKDISKESETGTVTANTTNLPYNGAMQNQSGFISGTENYKTSLTYNYKAYNYVYELNSEGKWVEKSRTETKSGTLTIPEKTGATINYRLVGSSYENVGTYQVDFVPDSALFSGSIEDVDWSITVIPLTIKVADTSVEYDGNTHSTTASATSGLISGQEINVTAWNATKVDGQDYDSPNERTNAGKDTISVKTMLIYKSDHTTEVKLQNYNINYVDGSLEVTPISITDDTKWFVHDATSTYNGANQDAFNVTEPDGVSAYVTGTVSGKAYTLTTNDYKVTDNQTSWYSEAGEHSFTIDGKNNFTGTRTVKFDIAKRDLNVSINAYTSKNVLGAASTFKVDYTKLEHPNVTIDGLVENQSISGTFNTTNTSGADLAEVGHYADQARYVSTDKGYVKHTCNITSGGTSVAANYNLSVTADMTITDTDILQVTIKGVSESEDYNAEYQTMTIPSGTNASTDSSTSKWSAEFTSPYSGFQFDASNFKYTGAKEDLSLCGVGSKVSQNIKGAVNVPVSAAGVVNVGSFSYNFSTADVQYIHYISVTVDPAPMLTINPINVTVTPNTDQIEPGTDNHSIKYKVYDGTALSFNNNELKATGAINNQYPAAPEWSGNSQINANPDNLKVVTLSSVAIYGKDAEHSSQDTNLTGNYIVTRAPGYLKVAKKDINDPDCSINTIDYDYNGYNQVEQYSVWDGAKQLTTNDYDLVTGSSQITAKNVKWNGNEVGEYPIVINGKGNYTGTKTAGWKIMPLEVEFSAHSISVVYDGLGHPITSADITSAQKLVANQTYKCSFARVDGVPTAPVNVEESGTEYKISSYDIFDTNNVSVTSNYIVTTKNGTVVITERDISTDDFAISTTNPYYNGTTQQTTPTITYIGTDPFRSDTELKKGVDYVLTSGYEGMDVMPNSATAIDHYTLVVTGHGNFKNTKSVNWNITPADAYVYPTSREWDYDGEAHSLTEFTFTHRETQGGPFIDGLAPADNPNNAEVTWNSSNTRTNYGQTRTKIDSVNTLYAKGSSTEVRPTTNYRWNYEYGTITINKKEITQADIDQGEVWYTYNSLDWTNTVSTVIKPASTETHDGFGLKFKVNDSSFIAATANDFSISTEAGSIYKAKDVLTKPSGETINYSFRIVLSDSCNFKASGNLYLYWQIRPRTLTITPKSVTETYSGSAYSIPLDTFASTEGLVSTQKVTLSNENVQITHVSGAEITTNSAIDVSENKLLFDKTKLKINERTGGASINLSNYAITVSECTLKVTPFEISNDTFTAIDGVTTYNGQEQDPFDMSTLYTYVENTAELHEGTYVPITITKQARAIAVQAKSAVTPFPGRQLEKGTDFDAEADYEKTDVQVDAEGNVISREITITGKNNFTGTLTVKWLMNKAWMYVYGMPTSNTESVKAYWESKGQTDYQNLYYEYDFNTDRDLTKETMFITTQAGSNKLMNDQYMEGSFKTLRDINHPHTYDAKYTFNYDGSDKAPYDPTGTLGGAWSFPDRWYDDPTPDPETQGQPHNQVRVGKLEFDYTITDGSSSNVEIDKNNYEMMYEPVAFISYAGQQMWFKVRTTAYVYNGNTAINLAIHTVDYEGDYDGNAHKREEGTAEKQRLRDVQVNNTADVHEKGKEEITIEGETETVDFGFQSSDDPEIQEQREKEAIEKAKKYGRTWYYELKHYPSNIGYFNAARIEYTPNTGGVATEVHTIMNAVSAYNEGVSLVSDNDRNTISLGASVGSCFTYTLGSDETDFVPQWDTSLDLNSRFKLKKKDVTITPDTDKIKSGTTDRKVKWKLYDGVEWGFDAGEFTADGLITYDSQEHTASITWNNKNRIVDAGEVTGVKAASATITGKDAAHSEDSDLSSNYNVISEEGKLVVDQGDVGDEDTYKSFLSATDYVYNGQLRNSNYQVKGEITGSDGAKHQMTLVKDRDYTLSADDGLGHPTVTEATDAGTYYITIQGKGNFTGTNTITWQITPINLKITPTGYTTKYDGREHQPTTFTQTGLVSGQQLVVNSYDGKLNSTGTYEQGFTIKDAGTADFKVHQDSGVFDITITYGGKTVALTNYNISSDVSQITITPRDISEENDFRMEATGHQYNGDIQSAEIVVRYVGTGSDYFGDQILDPTDDYDLDGSKTNSAKNVKVDGKYLAGVTGKGNFTGYATAEWNNTPAPATLKVTNQSYTYDGEKHSLSEATMEGKQGTDDLDNTYLVWNSADEHTNVGVWNNIKPTGFKDNLIAANTPSTNYSWTIVGGKLEITQRNIPDPPPEGDEDEAFSVAQADELTFQYDATEKILSNDMYEGKIKGKLVKDGEEYALNLQKGEYEIVTDSATSVYKATNVGDYNVKIRGLGNFKGEITTKWHITKANMKIQVTPDSKTFKYAGVDQEGNVNKHTINTYSLEVTEISPGLSKEGALLDVTCSEAPSFSYGTVGEYSLTPNEAQLAKFGYKNDDNVTVTYIPGEGKMTIVDKPFDDPDPDDPGYDEESGYILVTATNKVYNFQDQTTDTKVYHVHTVNRVETYRTEIDASSYTLTGQTYKNVGTYDVTATAKGNTGYSNFATTQWKITPLNLSVVANGKTLVVEYDGKPHTVEGVTFDNSAEIPSSYIENVTTIDKSKRSYNITETNVRRDADNNVIPYTQPVYKEDFTQTSDKDNVILTYTAGDDLSLKITPRTARDEDYYTVTVGKEIHKLYDDYTYVIDPADVTVTAHLYNGSSYEEDVVLQPKDYVFEENQSTKSTAIQKLAYDNPDWATEATDTGIKYHFDVKGSGLGNYEDIPFYADAAKASRTSQPWWIDKRNISDPDPFVKLKGELLRWDGTEKIQEVEDVTLSPYHPKLANNLLFATNDDGMLHPTYSVVAGTDRGTDPKVYQIKLEGTGNYYGPLTRAWMIIKEDIIDEGEGYIHFKINDEDAEFTPTEVAEDETTVIKYAGDINQIADMYDQSKFADPSVNGDYTVWLNVQDKDPEADVKAQFENEFAQKTLTLYKYLDINMNGVTTIDGRGVTADNPITELNKPGDMLTITMGVPQAYIDKVVGSADGMVHVLREHDGQINEIETVFDMDAQTVTFTADKFSNYAFAYNSNSAENVTPQTGDTLSIVLIGAIATLTLALAAYFVFSRRKTYSGKHVGC